MFAAKITAMSKTSAPPLASVYLPTFSMLLLLTSTYATEIGPLFEPVGGRWCLAATEPALAVAGAAFATPAMPANDNVSTLALSRTFHLDLDPRIVDQAPLLDEGDGWGVRPD